MPPPAPAYIYAPPVLPYNEGDPIPLGYHKGTTPRASLAIAGAITFGIAWIPSLVVGTFGAPLLAIPVGGAFVMASSARGYGSGPLKAWLVIDGLQQTAGLIMIIVALAAHKTVLLRDETRSTATWLIPRPIQLGTNGWGVGFGGQL